jgi:threonine dehydrogenase-like Zn-dependent dehydrogenase
VNNDQIIQGSFSYTRRAFAEVVERLNARDLRPGFVITHRFDLERVDEAVATLRGAERIVEPRGKVVLDLTN